MLLAGYRLAYVPEAVVIHSHDRSARYELSRTRALHERLSQLFGLQTIPTLPLLARAIASSLPLHVQLRGYGPPSFARAIGWAVAWPLGQYLGARDGIRRAGTSRSDWHALMRTLVVVHGLPPLAQGGAELCAYWHATTLARVYGDDVLVIAREGDPTKPEYAVRRERRDDVSIAWINNTYAATRSFAETYDNPAITAIAAGLVDEFKPEIAHIHHLTGLSTGIVPLLRARGIPCIATLHDYWLLCHRGQLLDLHLRLCAGPEPDGCAHCLGLAGSAPPVVHRAAAAFRAVERNLPDAAAKTLRGAAERVVSLAADARGNDDEARARYHHMRDLCAAIDRFVAPSTSIRDRFVAFGVPAGKIDVIRYGIPRLSGCADRACVDSAFEDWLPWQRDGLEGTAGAARGVSHVAGWNRNRRCVRVDRSVSR